MADAAVEQRADTKAPEPAGEEPKPQAKAAPYVVGTVKVRAPSLNTLDTHYAMANETQWSISWSTWDQLIKGAVLPRHVKTPEGAMALAEAGRMHGWSPLQSVRLLCLIEGQVSMTVNGLWMLVQSHVRTEDGSYVKFVENTLERAAIEVCRPLVSGPDPFVYEFTQADAVTAKLWGKTHTKGDSPWVLYPRDMLLARCKARVARNAFGDVVHGAYTDEELTHGADFKASASAVVNDILDRKVKPTTLDEIAKSAPAGDAKAAR